MATPVYPATNNSEAIELNISNANQFFTILQGGVDDYIQTYEGNGEIPSVAKALHEAAAYKTPLAWQTSGEETDLLQPRLFNGDIYVPLSVPAPFNAAPDSAYWRMYSTRSAGVSVDNQTFTGDGTTTDFSIPSMVVDDPAAYLVSIDGIEQRPTIDYTIDVSTDTLSFVEAPPATAADNISVTILGALRGAIAEEIYANVADGIAATFNGKFFHVVSEGDPEVYVDLYRNDSGVGTLIASYPNAVAYDNFVNEVMAIINKLTGGMYQSLTGGGTLTEGEHYYITDSLTYTLPDTSGIAAGASVVVTKAVGESPVVDTFGVEQIVTSDDSVTSLSLADGAESVLIWNGTNWELVAGDGNSASDVPYSNATSGLSATNTQAAIDEVVTELDAHKSAPDPHPQYVLETDLAANTGASLVGTSSGDTVEEAINGNASEIQDLNASTAKLSGGANANFSVMPQVGGDPIVESGSNADGEWTRWADGTQYVGFKGSAAIDLVAYQSLYQGGTSVVWPRAFAQEPCASVGRVNWSTGRPWGTAYAVTQNDASITFLDVSPRTTLSTFRFSVTATGRWK